MSKSNILPAPTKIILKVSKINIVNEIYIPQKKNNKFEVVQIGEDVPSELLISIGDMVFIMMGEGDYTHNTIKHNVNEYIVSDYTKIIGKLVDSEIKSVYDDTILLEILKPEEILKIENKDRGILLMPATKKERTIKLSIGKAIENFNNEEFDIKKGDYVYYSFGYFIAENWKTYNAVNLSDIAYYYTREGKWKK